jgi:recombinational DNA repair ATPase RecF
LHALAGLTEAVFAMQCFSSVVGPNGSGKSNVIDAMLFVFGRRAKQVSAADSGLCACSCSRTMMEADAQLPCQN